MYKQGILAYDRSDSPTFSGNIVGSGDVDQLGGGTLTLSGINTYTGPTQVATGILQAGSAFAFGFNSAVGVASGATLALNNYNVSIGSLGDVSSAGGTVNDGTSGTATLTVGGNNATTIFDGTIVNGSAGSVALTKVGSGSLTLTGASTYGGNTTVNAGTLVAGNTSVITTGTTTVAAGTLEIDGTWNTPILNVNGGSTSLQGLGQLAGSGTLNLSSDGIYYNSATASTFAGAVTGSSSTVEVDGGTLTLSGNSNTYGAVTTVVAGTLVAANSSGSATGSSMVLVQNTATLADSAATTTPAISGAVNVNGGGGIAAVSSATMALSTLAFDYDNLPTPSVATFTLSGAATSNPIVMTTAGALTGGTGARRTSWSPLPARRRRERITSSSMLAPTPSPISIPRSRGRVVLPTPWSTTAGPVRST